MLLDILNTLIQPDALFAMTVGSIFGMLCGAIPGLGAGIGMTLVLPIIFLVRPEIGLLVLISLWMSTNYGDSIPAILMNIPGTGGAVFTCLDGYPYSQQGKAGVAMGMSLTASVIGALIGIITLIIFAPLIAKVSVLFGSSEYFLLSILALTLVASVSRGTLLKGFIMAGLGVSVSLIGIDILTGYPRNTFATAYLLDGIEFRVFLIGVFAIGRIIARLPKQGAISSSLKLQGRIIDGVKLALKHWVTALKGGIIGTAIGALPGAGISAATAIAYNFVKQSSKNPEKFGHGAPEGLIATDAANNAVQGGSLIPTLTLGIPGSTSAAVFLGGLIMYGLRPGGKLFVEQSSFVWTIFLGMIFAAFIMAITGFLLTPLITKITIIPINILFPAVLIVALTGTYAINNRIEDIFVVIIFGLLGIMMVYYDYPFVPAVLGIILGPMAEENFFRSLIISKGSFGIFHQGLINKTLILIIVIILIKTIYSFIKQDRKA